MTYPSDPAQGPLRLAERLIQLLDQGSFSATYKYAVLLALMDLCLEYTSTTGHPPESLTTRILAEKVIQLYWSHSMPFQGDRVLRQSTGGANAQAEILRRIIAFREEATREPSASLPLTEGVVKGLNLYFSSFPRMRESSICKCLPDGFPRARE